MACFTRWKGKNIWKGDQCVALMRGSYENCVDINAKQIACIGQICKKQDAQYTRYMSESSLPPILFRRHNNFTSPNLVYTAIPRYRKIKWKSRYQASTYRIREHHINHPMHISWWRRKNTPTERQWEREWGSEREALSRHWKCISNMYGYSDLSGLSVQWRRERLQSVIKHGNNAMLLCATRMRHYNFNCVSDIWMQLIHPLFHATEKVITIPYI